MRCFAIIGILALSLLNSQAQEWTRFRGPDGSGIGKLTGLKPEITEKDYAWSVKLDGLGHSSPMLWGEKVFLTISDPDGTNRRVQCFDAKTGAVAWTWSVESEPLHIHKFNTFTSSSPTVDADRVYVAWVSGTKTEVVALDHSGKLAWKRDWPGFSADHGFGCSPVLADGVLVFQTDSSEETKTTLYGLDPATGKTLWQMDRPAKEGRRHNSTYSTPIVINLEGQTMLVVLQGSDGWRGIAPKTGKVLWQFDGEYRYRSVGSIATGGGVLVACMGTGGKGLEATALRPRRGGEPEVLYSLGKTDGLSYVPTPLIYEGRLYIMSDAGILSCFHASTGTLIYRERVGGNFFSSSLAAGGKIMIMSREGELVILQPGDKFEVLGRSKLGNETTATPAIANNHIYVRTDSELICIPGM